MASHSTLNLGILAHVDAGKTTLTERLLYSAGVIRTLGSVDEGTTQTDSLALERERGITIKSAVASFAVGDLGVNLIDTPGHPDFIAEVERVLSVLDGAVLVVSAVESVQSQTPILMRALQRLGVPTVIFVNKIDRPGADTGRVVAAIARRLTPSVLPMGAARDEGTRTASFVAASWEDPAFAVAATEVLAELDDSVLSTYVRGERSLSATELRSLLAEKMRIASLHPVFLGSATTGAGVEALMDGIAGLLPAAAADANGPPSGRVFKIERTATGERVAYVRLFGGTIRTRDRIRYGAGTEGRVTGITVFHPDGAVRRPAAGAGEIARVSGLADVRVGDAIGDRPPAEAPQQFAPPTLESIVVPANRTAGGRLRTALNELAEQDPLINVRQDGAPGQIAVSLYGEVQKEVIGETLAREYGIPVEFSETTTVCVERPVGTGEALEVIRAPRNTNIMGRSSPHSDNPFPATLGLRIAPGGIGSGVELHLDVEARLIPLSVYKTIDAFAHHLGEYVRDALHEGLHGWEVTDCVVTVTESGYRQSGTTAGDFRRLTPIVVMTALERARTDVCEPMTNATLDLPNESVSRVLPYLAALGTTSQTMASDGERSTLDVLLRSGRLHDLQRSVPGLTGGEGVIESRFAGYRRVGGPPPVRARRRPDPRVRDEYLMHLHRRMQP